MKIRMIMMAVVFSLIATSVQAGGGEKGDFEIEPYAGYYMLDKYGLLNPKAGVSFGLRFGYFMTSAASFEVAYQHVLTKSQIPAVAGIPNQDGNIYATWFNFLYNFMAGSKFRPFLTLGLGWKQTNFKNSLYKSNDVGVNVGPGFRYMFTPLVGLRFDFRYIGSEVGDTALASDGWQNDFEVSGGVTFLFGGSKVPDSDGDGVNDRKDKCPDTPNGAIVDANGCPSDEDGDGVMDGVDKCPGTEQGVSVDGTGCPLDSDGDGVPDHLDECADTPAGAKVDAKGCPEDADGDGVPDSQDECPNTPAGTPVDEKGCTSDEDGDGVADHVDQCPKTTKGTKVDAKGCPEQSIARGVLKGVNFKTGSSTLTAASFGTLNGVAAELKNFPKVKVEVQGHTDSTGSNKTNMRISKARAQSVVDYLVSKGVDKNRLVSFGYGSSKPIADNTTKAGRRANRRVELHWID